MLTAETNKYSTEGIHPQSDGLDTLPVEELVRLLLEEQQHAVTAITLAAPQIVTLTRAYAETYRSSGRIFYVGAGTSGRLSLLDAVELSPTFGIPSDRVQVLLAEEETAPGTAMEAAEDDESAGREAIRTKHVRASDLVIGISASGETRFVLAAMAEARACGATTAAVTNNVDTALERAVDLPIVVATGPELIAGSTRLKAGTVQKIVLNLLSTAAMVSLGKVYDGFMIDLQVTNNKLKRRAEKMLVALSGESTERVREALIRTGWQVKSALLILKAEITCKEAEQLLQGSRDSLREALQQLHQEE